MVAEDMLASAIHKRSILAEVDTERSTLVETAGCKSRGVSGVGRVELHGVGNFVCRDAGACDDLCDFGRSGREGGDGLEGREGSEGGGELHVCGG